MKHLLSCLAVLLMTTTSANPDNANRSLFDFTASGSGAGWIAVNDGVMGGRSQGGPEFDDGLLHFSGRLSLENNGGFSSIRHDIDLDLGGFTGLRLRVKGDGRTYQLRLQTGSRYYGRAVAYSGQVATRRDQWIEVDVPFDSLRAGFRGRSLTGYTFDPSGIQRIGLLLADKQPGAFSMQVQWIKAYQ